MWFWCLSLDLFWLLPLPRLNSGNVTTRKNIELSCLTGANRIPPNSNVVHTLENEQQRETPKKTIVCIRLTQKSPPPVQTIKKRKLKEFRSTYPISWSNQRPESHKNSIAKKYRCLTDWCTPQDDCNWTFRIKVAVLQVTHAFNPQYVSSGFLVAPIKDAFMRSSTAHKRTVCSIYILH